MHVSKRDVTAPITERDDIHRQEVLADMMIERMKLQSKQRDRFDGDRSLISRPLT